VSSMRSSDEFHAKHNEASGKATSELSEEL